MSPYRIAPATAAPTPKRSAVVRLWRMGKRDLFRQPHPALSALALWPLWALVFGYLRLRRVRAALAPCPTHRAMGKHGRCGNVTCCNDCSQAWAAEGFTRYPAITEARERLPPPRANAEQAKPREQAQATVTTTTRTHYRIRVRTIVR